METDKTYFQNNMRLLKRHHPEVWETINAVDARPLGELCIAEDGKPNLKIRNAAGETLYLHNNQTPESELSQFLGLVPEAATGVVVFIGMGLGYGPMGILKSRPQIRHLAVFEPEIQYFIKALEALDLSTLLTDKRVVIAIGPDLDIAEKLAPMSRTLVLETIHILNHIASANTKPETYQKLYDDVYKQGNSYNLGGSTTRTYGKKFIENRLQHMSTIHNQNLLEHLQSAFKDIPAIIIAGGPSLNKNIHLLPEAKGKAVLIGVDTVLPALLKNGVTPDFTTTIDMQDIVIEKIIDVSETGTDTALVCSAWVSPNVPKIFPARQVYWTFAAKHMEMWMNKLYGGKLLTGGAGTVAHLSFTTAVLLGCSPIIFVGQDLSYTNKEDHVQHTSLTEKDGLNRLYELNEIVWTEGYGDTEVPTTRAWLSDKHHFENAIAGQSDRIFINATEGGVRIHGTEEISLREALDRFCHKNTAIDVHQQESDIMGRMPSGKNIMNELHRISGIISKCEKDMTRLEASVQNVRESLKKLGRQGRRYKNINALPVSLRKKINIIDTLNKQLDRSEIWKLLEEGTMTGLLFSERLHHNIRLLEGKPEKFMEWLDKSIERILYINQIRHEVLPPFKEQIKNLHTHLGHETDLKKNLKQTDNNAFNTQLELMRCYYDNGDYMLLEKQIQTICSDETDPAEIFFYKGAVAANQSQFDKADNFFDQAVSFDPVWTKHIEKCRRKIGSRYSSFSKEWQVIDRNVALRMLFKGFRCCRKHPGLSKKLTAQAQQAVKDAESALEQDTLSEMSDRLEMWNKELSDTPNLISIIGTETASALYKYYGNMLVNKEDYAKAGEAFSSAITLTPQAPDLHLLHADTAFAVGDYTNGVKRLDHAVALDRRYAKFWENMGDNLVQTGQPEDAVEAYNRCFMSLPENIGVLKKIGDCYQSMNQPEAALKAYQILKTRMGNIDQIGNSISPN